MNQPSNKRSGTPTPRTKQHAVKPVKKAAKQQEAGHKQRFDQLLDDVVLGKPKKR